jgi:hypothetical protein
VLASSGRVFRGTLILTRSDYRGALTIRPLKPYPKKLTVNITILLTIRRILFI